jgi:hypothetical protein
MMKITESGPNKSGLAVVFSGLDRVSRGLSATSRYITTHAADITVFVVCILLYYIVIARRYFGADIVIGGDTQLAWSMDYLAMESLIVRHCRLS